MSNVTNSKMYFNKIQTADGEKGLVTINWKPEDEASVTSVSQLHHIHILDRSYSMSNDIDELINNVKQTVKLMGDDDIVSVIWFASAGQYRTVLKGVQKSDNVDKILDSLRSTVGTTCFSEVLQEAENVADDLTTLCPNVSMTLFTDGDTVTPWSRQEEAKRIYDVIASFQGKILALNTVGYGYYYDKDLLTDITLCTEFGTTMHSSDIDEYSEIFKGNYEKISNITTSGFKVEAQGEMVYLTSNFTKSVYGSLVVGHAHARKNQIFILGDVGGFDVYLEDRIYRTEDMKGTGQSTKTNYFYAKAFNDYYLTRRGDSLNALLTLQDKYLIDSHMSAFTADEVASHSDVLKKALFKGSKGRMLTGEAPEDYLPATDAPCVMGLLTELIGNSDRFSYLPFHKDVAQYERATRKNQDSFKVFQASKDEVVVPFSELVTNKKYLNLSVKFKQDGVVTMNPVRAKEVGFSTNKFDSYQYRTHMIIKDGHLHLKELAIRCTVLDMGVLKSHYPNIKYRTLSTPPLERKLEKSSFAIDLTSLPLVNSAMINDISLEDIATKVNAISYAEAKQKVLKYLIGKCKDNNATARKEGSYKTYSVTQIDCMKEHGIDKNFAYKGVSPQVAKVEDCDSYEVREFEFYVKGLTSLPAIEKTLTEIENGSKMTPSREVIASAYLAITQGKDLKFNSKEKTAYDISLRHEQEYLLKLRTELATLRIAKILTGDFFEGLTLNEKGQFSYESVDEDITIIGRTKYSTVYVD